MPIHVQHTPTPNRALHHCGHPIVSGGSFCPTISGRSAVRRSLDWAIMHGALPQRAASVATQAAQAADRAAGGHPGRTARVSCARRRPCVYRRVAGRCRRVSRTLSRAWSRFSKSIISTIILAPVALIIDHPAKLMAAWKTATVAAAFEPITAQPLDIFPSQRVCAALTSPTASGRGDRRARSGERSGLRKN